MLDIQFLNHIEDLNLVSLDLNLHRRGKVSMFVRVNNSDSFGSVLRFS